MFLHHNKNLGHKITPDTVTIETDQNILWSEPGIKHI